MPVPLRSDETTDEPTASEAEGLREILRRRLYVVVSILAPLPVVLVLSVLAPAFVQYALPLVVANLLVAAWRNAHSLCPRCKEKFYEVNPWRLACVHCGLDTRSVLCDGAKT